MRRKTKYTAEVGAQICERLSKGETMSSICSDKNMPQRTTIYSWLNLHKDFAEQVARARELGFDAIAEEALQIANTPEIGEETEYDGGKIKVKRADMLGHRKLQVWTRLQLLTKWCPGKYGDRRTVDVTVNEPLADRLARAKKREAKKK